MAYAKTTITSIPISPEEDRRQSAYVQIMKDDRDVGTLLDLFALIVDKEDWTRLKDDSGRDLTFELYITLPYAKGGIGWKVHNLQTLLKMKHEKECIWPEVEERMRRLRGRVADLLAEQMAEHGGDRRSESKSVQVRDTNLKSEGETARNQLRRLKRDRPDLAEKVINREMTAYAAAIEAGFRTPSFHCPKEVQGSVRALRRNFSTEDVNEIIRLLCEETP